MADLVIFGGAAAARNGLTAMPVNGGEDMYKINSTNNLVIPENMHILRSGLVSGTIANITQWRHHRLDSNDWSDFGTGNARDQTGAFTPDFMLPSSEMIPGGKQIAAEVGNTNNSQVDQILMFLGKTPNEALRIGNAGQVPLPAGYAWHRFTGAKTLTAGILSEVALTPVSFSPDDGVKHHIAGLVGWGATAIAGRVKHKKGGTQDIRPGFLMGDDAVPAVMQTTFQDFGQFTGDSFPNLQVSAVAADTAQEFLMLIKAL